MAFAKDLLGDIERLLVDATNLEVNTIVKAQGMTARKMPAMPLAMLDIAANYLRFLRRCGDACGYAPPETDSGEADVYRRPDHELRLSIATFDAVRAIAIGIGARPAFDELPARERLVVGRIRQNCTQLLGLLHRRFGQELEGADDRLRREALEVAIPEQVADARWSGDARVLVHKIWDVGTEYVVMQTVVQLDGDVVTRVQEDIATGGNPSLQRVHHAAVEVSLRHWEFLLRAIGAMVRFVRG